ncbi:pentatricopeptide repeat-containing protein At5g46100 [Ziziphus jujuba]|uniref:Pentatricopeptide repeat-containing protein At5g46100 n=5 Tax=Ziziphus jujuba TaxID=326968 RepID=A0A6P6FU16_ZIZJJ|nr:pentatricopeptide repeat-containing protein At5g46100 [Ziziphus jujuba]XP_015874847.3 pentatricopeptide repeat-containing protein At5g46100 [Ziziphus jujuba]XP_024925053.3 pentatricopeptide repeat-containing protein At5g46100 [Ziziphus jujuba]XP_024925056.3 pentatricopeptide repeat-containing protein At5g46100 [Ziziphus jujuba]XP_060674699.1 pentatricopeptide repeat-containing protein At5g46100 [Ziziphus jujuba]XP_060674705.1 pentatricopeptide repeat-containing protein At5g46100 [Ziziphus j
MGTKAMFKWSKQITPAQVERLIRAEKDVQKATLIFDSATAEYSNGYRHDHSTFALMISRLVSANQFRSAEALLNRMKEEKCNITEDIFLSICRSYGRVHRPLDAIRVFQKMEDFLIKPTQKCYITIFAILVEENQLKLAFRFYRYMKKMGIPLCVASLNILIKGLCKNSGTMGAALRVFREMASFGFTPDSYTYGTLINGFSKLGKIVEAKELFKEMEMKGCSPSVVTYTNLIHGLCQSNNLDEAMALFEEMKSKGVSPNVFSYSSLMDGFCKGGRSSQAMELLRMMVSECHLPNMVTFSTLIYGLCKEGKLQEALEILDRMKLQGLKPDAGLYGKIITGFCDIFKFQEAANLIDEMVLGGISPNRVTWSLHTRIHSRVAQGLCTIGNVNRAFQLYLSMRTRGITIDAFTFDSLVKCFCKKGDLHKAARIVDEMLHDGCVPDEETWSSVVSGFWDRRKVREAAELLQAGLMNDFVEA